MKKSYTIGLDIGTNSVGWAVMKDDLTLIRKRMNVYGNTEVKKLKKNFWGSRLFDSGKTAVDRRLKRGTRRRYTRRRNRLIYLQNIFSEAMKTVDENFFDRLDESFYITSDKTYNRHPIFGTLAEEVAYHEAYPTIYHLRQALADSTEQADLRLIYMALAHIVKYRGHFLFEGLLNVENTSISAAFEEFLEEYNKLYVSELSLDKSTDIEAVFSEKVAPTKKRDTILKLFNCKSTSNFDYFLKLIVGLEVNFKSPFQLTSDHKLSLSSATYDEDLDELLTLIGDEYLDLFVATKNVYDAVKLASILTEDSGQTNAKLSQQMITHYNDHKEDLARLKSFIKQHCSSERYNECFNDESKNGYAGYINGSTTQEEFYKYIKDLKETADKQFKTIHGAEYFIDKIEREVFLRKQRSFHNASIPHQIHLEELRSILDRQEQYYPFLAEARDKIESLVTFRIPYYVGPLTSAENSEFAWMKRNTDEPIRPWNFDDIVDKEASAKRFIERMTNKDTYLPEENVLPKRSLLYQRFEVYNELTKVKYKTEQNTWEFLNQHQKETIVSQLFKTQHTVREKDIVNYLEQSEYAEATQVKGIDAQFNAKLSTYNDLAKIDGMQVILDDPDRQEDLEKIIKILTIFEDRSMRQKQLEAYSDVLSAEIIKKLSRKHYTGWGRLSKKLLNGLRDGASNKTIIDYLKSDEDATRMINRNFQQLIKDDTLTFKKQIEEAQDITIDQSLSDIVAELPGSPAIKKGILQALTIVEEIIAIMGYRPDNIVVEMARENQTTQYGKEQSKKRAEKLKKGLKELAEMEVSLKGIKDQPLHIDRLYLYYLQNGKDMYTGKSLEIDKVISGKYYEIDHIIPQSFTADNSIDNRVLVAFNTNQSKSDDVPPIEVVRKMKPLWKQLQKAGLMSDRKFSFLTKSERGGLTDADKANFLNRQLVETRQITKHVANILDSQYNQPGHPSVDIILLQSAMTSRFRREFGLYKVRELNDYHHAHDAYLNAFIATKLLKLYPKLKPQFIYGQYAKTSNFKREKATAQKYFMTNITKFFKKEEKVIDNQTGELLWDRNKEIATIKKVLSWKQMNIVKKVEKETGQFYKETIHAADEASDKSIPLKRGLDPKTYGSKKSSETAYSVVIEYSKTYKKGVKRKRAIVNIFIMDQKAYEQHPTQFLEQKGYQQPDVLLRLLNHQLIELEGGARRLISGGQALQKGNQLVLPLHLMAFIHKAKYYKSTNQLDNDKIQSKLSKVLFDELLEEVSWFVDKYLGMPKTLSMIQKRYETHGMNNLEQTIDSFVNLLSLSAMGATKDFTFFDKKIERERYRSLAPIWGSTLIYQSITGLYETRYRLEKK